MGACNCTCCGSDEDAKKDAYLDKYLNKWHREPHKMAKHDKKDFFNKQDFEVRTYRACKVNEILDEFARRQDLQTEDGLTDEQREAMLMLTNRMGAVAGKKSKEQTDQEQSALNSQKKVEENSSVLLGGENGTGGRPLKPVVANPYLEIDLIDPTDPILFEGEIQKYKPGFKTTFIDRWVQVTSKSFRYFVSKPGKDNQIIKPLLAIPIRAIQDVSRVNYDLNVKKGDKRAKELAKHQFEFFLREDFIDFFLTPAYERQFVPDGRRYNSAIEFLEKNQSRRKGSPNKKDGTSLKEKYLLGEENKLDDVLSGSAMSTLDTKNGAWTNREERWVLEDRRLLFATKSEIATQEWVEILDALVNPTTDGGSPN